MQQISENGSSRTRFQCEKRVFYGWAKQLFAKACARRRVAFAKSCFTAAVSSGSFANFLCAFFSLVFNFLASVFEIIVPRALKNYVAGRWTNKCAHFYTHGVPRAVGPQGHRPDPHILLSRQYIFPFWGCHFFMWVRPFFRFLASIFWSGACHFLPWSSTFFVFLAIVF